LTSKGNKMQNKPKTNDLFEMANFSLVPLKWHRKLQRITIRHDEFTGGIAVDFRSLVGGGFSMNAGREVKIWKVRK